jgi:hypothetical protein
MVFDSKGSLLQRDTTQCQWSGYKTIRALSPDSVYLKHNGLQLGEILARIHPIGQNSWRDALRERVDFTVVITWAKFLGSCNTPLFELSDAVRQNKAARISLIWLNIDMQESWNLTKSQKLELK